MKRQAFSVMSRLNPWQQVLLSAVLVTLAAPAAAQLRAPGARTQGIFMPQQSGSTSTVAPTQPQMGIPQPAQKRSQLVDEVVAIVNNSVITRRELLDRADEIENQLRAANRTIPERPDLLGEVLERLVMERVQTQAAQDAGIKVTDQEVDRAIESVAQQNKMSATDLRSRVEASGMSWTKYRDELRK